MQQLMGWVLMLAGASAFLYGLVVPRWPVARAASWPSVSGTVTHSLVLQSTETSFTSGTTNTMHGAQIKYQYQVGERRYRNDEVHVGGSLATSMPSYAQAQRYPQGADIDVFYNPDKPAQSCLEKSEQVSLLSMGIGVLFLIVGYGLG
ncbi:MAG: hypothetical protein ACI9DC_000770 [Gammaproteobacteria bacterium]|jgi:hypothetical protein